MALIKCPECGKTVSDSAKACPECGFGVAEYFEKQKKKQKEEEEKRAREKSEQEKFNDVLKSVQIPPKHRASKYIASIVFGLFFLLLAIVVMQGYPEEGKGIFITFLVIGVALMTFVPLAICLDEKDRYDKIQADVEGYKRKTAQKIIAIQNVSNNINSLEIDRSTIICPKCLSKNVQFIGQEVYGARDSKTKTVTKVNLNPLKPFTVFEHEDKVVKKAREGSKYDRWRCNDCGHIFERKV